VNDDALPESNAACCARPVWVALLILVALGGFLRFQNLGREALWLDEQCQLAAAQQPDFASFWKTAGESGPIGRLSYFDCWLVWRMGGDSRAALRFPAALYGTLSLAMVFVFARRWFSDGPALFAVGLVAVNALHIQYSREARGYALLVLTALVWAHAFLLAVERPDLRRASFLALATLLALAAHPVIVAPMACGALALPVFWRRMRPAESAPFPKTLGAVYGAMALSAAVWFVWLQEMRQATHNPLPVPQNFAHETVDIYKALVGGYWGVSSYFVFALALAGVWLGLRAESFRRGAIVSLAISAAGVVPIAVGIWKNTQVVSRYALFALPFLMVFAALGCNALFRRASREDSPRKTATWRASLAALAFALMLLGGTFLQGRSPYDLERGKRPDSRWPVLEH
jgi:mannosyltransferase